MFLILLYRCFLGPLYSCAFEFPKTVLALEGAISPWKSGWGGGGGGGGSGVVVVLSESL